MELNYTIIKYDDVNQVQIIGLPIRYTRLIHEVANRNKAELFYERWVSVNNPSVEFEKEPKFNKEDFNYEPIFQFNSSPYMHLFEWDVHLTLEVINDLEHNLTLT